VVRVDVDDGMLPHVAYAGGEDDVAAARGGVVGDEAELLRHHVPRVERKAGRPLARVIDIVLSVGDHSDGETGVGRLLGQAGGGRQKAECQYGRTEQLPDHRHGRISLFE